MKTHNESDSVSLSNRDLAALEEAIFELGLSISGMKRTDIWTYQQRLIYEDAMYVISKYKD